MRLVSYYKSKGAAEKAAKKLRKVGAKGVKLGTKDSKGYPVYSTLGGY